MLRESAVSLAPLMFLELTQISAGRACDLPCGVSPLPYSAKMRYCIIKPVTRTAVVVNNITMPRSVRRLRRAPFFYLKQIARARHPTLCWVMRIGAFAFAEHTKLSLASRKTVAFARMSGGNGARLQAAFYAVCLKRSLPTRCHSEPPRMRRVEESA